MPGSIANSKSNTEPGNWMKMDEHAVYDFVILQLDMLTVPDFVLKYEKAHHRNFSMQTTSRWICLMI